MGKYQWNSLRFSSFRGTGLGTFASVYPAYEESLTPNRFSHAHSDYLEFLSELGIVGLILLLGGILFMLVHSFLIWRERRHTIAKGLALGGIVTALYADSQHW